MVVITSASGAAIIILGPSVDTAAIISSHWNSVITGSTVASTEALLQPTEQPKQSAGTFTTTVTTFSIVTLSMMTFSIPINKI